MTDADQGAARTSRQTILIADDTPENIDLLSALLRQDYRVKVATSGEKALAIVNSAEPPDLILLDIMMPGMNGYDVCHRIRDNPDRRGIPIIFVTAMTSIEDERLGLEIGAVDYITKPISPPIVMARVRTHLALYDQTRVLEDRVRARTAELFRIPVIGKLDLSVMVARRRQIDQRETAGRHFVFTHDLQADT